jgi:hypothetical protein
LTSKTSTTVDLIWTEGAHNGGLQVTDYRVSYRIKNDQAYTVVGYVVTQTSHTITSLSLGVTYEFIVEARNEVGYSAPTSSLEVLHALAPESP